MRASRCRGPSGSKRFWLHNRKAAILGGPNTAERFIEYAEAKPRLTALGGAVRTVPVVGKVAGFAIDNPLTQRATGQTGVIMGEAGKLLTRTGREGIAQTFDEISALTREDLRRRQFNEALAAQLGAWSDQRAQREQP